MQNEVIIAGSGGQGVLFGGILLAQAAMEEGRETTWFPSYGAEMRGGTANSTVVISDKEIGSPIVIKFSSLIALNELSLNKFSVRLRRGGILVVNSSLAAAAPSLDGITVVTIPATGIADKELKDVRVANVVAIGAYLKKSGILSLESARKACEKLLCDKPKLIPLNQKALELGYNNQ